MTTKRQRKVTVPPTGEGKTKSRVVVRVARWLWQTGAMAARGQKVFKAFSPYIELPTVQGRRLWGGSKISGCSHIHSH